MQQDLVAQEWHKGQLLYLTSQVFIQQSVMCKKKAPTIGQGLVNTQLAWCVFTKANCWIEFVKLIGRASEPVVFGSDLRPTQLTIAS